MLVLFVSVGARGEFIRASGSLTDADSSNPICDALIEYTELALKDTWHVLSFPIRWHGDDWFKATVAVIGVTAVAAFDEPIRDVVQRNRSRSLDEAVEVFEPLGAGYAPYVVGGFMLGGIVFRSPRERHLAFDAFMANLIAAQNITPALKKAFGRKRPNEGDDAYDLDPYSGYNSFPSGHATRAFALASVVAAHYDERWIDIIAYGSAGIVALARVVHNVHFTSDVVAGALIGTSVGRSVVGVNRREQVGSRSSAVRVMLGPGPEGMGVAIMVVF